MGKGSAPKYDAGAAVASQTASNNAATKTNAAAAGKTNTFGSANYTFDANGMPTGQVQTLSDPLNAASGNIQGSVENASSWTPQNQFRLSDVPNGLPLADATFKQGMTYMQPEFDRQNKGLEVRMAERGLPVGSEGWRDANSVQQDSQNRAVTDLTQRSLLMTPAEEQRQIGNALTERNQGYADVNSGLGLLSGMGGLMPQAGAINQQTPVNAMGAYDQQYQSQKAAYDAKQQGMQNAVKMGVGLMAAPFTGGASLGLTAGGAAGMFGGTGRPGTATPGLEYSSALPWAPQNGGNGVMYGPGY